jgi:hypothetical protein
MESQRFRLFAAVLFATLAALLSTRGPAAQTAAADNVVLITLDGARTQEMFGGLDVDVLRSVLREGQPLESHPTHKRFWAPSAEE